MVTSEELDPVVGGWLDTMPVEREVPTLYRIWRQSSRYFQAGDVNGTDRCTRLMMLLRSSYVPPQALIERGVNFAYGGVSVVIHRRVVIRAHATIGQNVTLGAKESTTSSGNIASGAPIIGQGAFIGPGAVVLGRVSIGAFSIVGANAVVTRDLEPGSVVGVPTMRRIKALDVGNIVQYRSVFTSLRSLSDQQLLEQFQRALDDA